MVLADGTYDERRVMIASGMVALAATLAAADAVVIRMLAGEVHAFVIAFFRALFGLVAVLPVVLMRRDVLKTDYRFAHASRAALKLLALVCFFMAFAAAPLADAMAIMFMTPVFLMIGAWLWLGEKLTAGRVFAMAAAFGGAMIIIGPGGSHGWSPALLLALAGAALQALVQLMLKRMSARDTSETLVIWNLIVTVPIAAIPAALFWTPPGAAALGLLALQGVMGAANMALMTKAFSMAEASHIAPMDFVKLPMVALMAWAMFGETAEFSTWAGAVVIFAATTLVAGGGRILRRRT